MADEQVCPKCQRKGSVIVGAVSRGGSVTQRFECRVCKYSWVDGEANKNSNPEGSDKR